ncbi:DUF6313 family protein [Streptomyces sp. Qhu-G9]|uniref:DUF6313 family protein n=1 Tax=Streptomyces sp. Qhu-G9 TaxID=3452799 RepID=UPI003AF8470D
MPGWRLLFVLNGARHGWAAAYEVLTGITSPAKADPQRMTWPSSLAGWAAIPAFIGGTVGYRRPGSRADHPVRTPAPRRSGPHGSAHCAPPRLDAH